MRPLRKIPALAKKILQPQSYQEKILHKKTAHPPAWRSDGAPPRSTQLAFRDSNSANVQNLLTNTTCMYVCYHMPIKITDQTWFPYSLDIHPYEYCYNDLIF